VNIHEMEATRAGFIVHSPPGVHGGGWHNFWGVPGKKALSEHFDNKSSIWPAAPPVFFSNWQTLANGFILVLKSLTGSFLLILSQFLRSCYARGTGTTLKEGG
jgi:hypothetical protein